MTAGSEMLSAAVAEQAPPRPGWMRRALTLGAEMLRGCGATFFPLESRELPSPWEVMDPTEAAELMAAQGYARPAPRFADQAQDKTRTNTFAFQYKSHDDLRQMTEHQGLRQLRRYLGSTANIFHENHRVATAMRQNLTFIGEKEFAEGAAGLAAYWKKLLNDDPELRLGVFNAVSRGKNGRKSDTYLRERMLEHFTDQELQQYKGRLLVHQGQLEGLPPEHVRIILLDDWSISGLHMGSAYCWAKEHLGEAHRQHLEVNLLAVAAPHIQHGVRVSMQIEPLPVKAYFLAHEAGGPVDEMASPAYISGTHSTVDYNFKHPLQDMSGRVLRRRKPALARVSRSYRRLAEVQAQRVLESSGVEVLR